MYIAIRCPCPRWFPNNTWSGTHSWSNGAESFDPRAPPVCDPDNSSILIGEKVTYTCPEGFVFETPELILDGAEVNLMTFTCSEFGDWFPNLQPKCIRKETSIMRIHMYSDNRQFKTTYIFMSIDQPSTALTTRSTCATTPRATTTGTGRSRTRA